MSEKTKKSVLVVDDEQRMCKILRDRFTDCNENVDCPYKFEADVALSAAECVEKVRAKIKGTEADKPPYDVIVLGIRMEEETTGLKTNLALACLEEFGPEIPVRIIFTGYPNYSQCVEAMRYGAWDYIVKEDVGDTPMSQIVVNSALARPQQLDLRREQEQQIAADWLPRHLPELQPQYGGQLVALWHRPEVKVIASGHDAFELEANLKDWRKQHATWEQPFVVQIPLQRNDDEKEG